MRGRGSLHGTGRKIVELIDTIARVLIFVVSVCDRDVVFVIYANSRQIQCPRIKNVYSTFCCG